MWDIDKKYLQNDEVIEYEDKPSKISCIVAYIWIGFLALPTLGVFASNVSRSDKDTPVTFYFLIFILILVSPALLIILKRYSTRYAITNLGIVTRTGIITTNVKTIPFKFITSSEVNEGIVGKVLNYATVKIDTAGSGKAIELQWEYLSSAHNVKKMIDSKILNR